MSCRPVIRQDWLGHYSERPTSPPQWTSSPKFPTVSTSHVHHSKGIISEERRFGGSRMSSSAGLSKVSSSGQRQLTFSQLIPPSERTRPVIAHASCRVRSGRKSRRLPFQCPSCGRACSFFPRCMSTPDSPAQVVSGIKTGYGKQGVKVP